MDTPHPPVARIIAPPPLLYLVTLAVGLGLQVWSPQPILMHYALSAGMGIALLILSAMLARWSFVTMRHARTPASPRETSTALVMQGPFRFSRNPIYVAMTGLYLGVAFLFNANWIAWFAVPLLLIMHFGVIRREERYLAVQFGEAYRDYQSRVRCWL